ncbi:MAG TPA: hypothetical protein VGP72_12455 [Planctomycetota bacterium]|jgi:sugar phosphate isomerase/epimerase
MAGFSASEKIQLGIWLDDLRVELKAAMAAVGPLQPESVGLDAFGPELSPRTLSRSGRRDLVHYLRTRGTTLSALRADLGGRRLAEAGTLDVGLGRLREAWELANDLGAPHLVVAAGYVPDLAESDEKRARETLREAASFLATLSATGPARIAWLGGQEQPQTLFDFLQAVDSSGILGVDLNPGGYLMRGVDPMKALTVLSPRVTIVRAADHYRGGAEAPFGIGDVRWGVLLVALATLNRPAPIPVLAATNSDGDRIAAIAGAYKRLKSMRANPVA